MLRKARIGDVKAIHRMINLSSQKGEMLPRSLMDIYGNLRDFFVFYDKDERSVIGVCAMSIIWENLAEIRSLYVEEEHRRQGNRQAARGGVHLRSHHAGAVPRLYLDLSEGVLRAPRVSRGRAFDLVGKNLVRLFPVFEVPRFLR